MALRDWLTRRTRRGRRRAAPSEPPVQDGRRRDFVPERALLWDLPPITGGRRAGDDSDKVLVAETLGLHGRPQEGLGVLRPAGTAEPPAAVMMARAWLLYLEGRFQAARRPAAAAMRKLPPGDLRRLGALRCAWIHLATWELPPVVEAVGILESETLSGPWLPAAELARAQLLSLTGEVEAGRERWHATRDRMLQEPALRYQLAVAANDLGFYGDAARVIHETFALADLPETARALLWLEAGRALSLRGDTAPSRACYDLVVHDWPGLHRSKSIELKGEPRPGEQALLALLGASGARGRSPQSTVGS